MWGYNGSCRVFALFRVSKLHMGTARGSHCQTEGTRQIWPPEYGSLFAHKRLTKRGWGRGVSLGVVCTYSKINFAIYKLKLIIPKDLILLGPVSLTKFSHSLTKWHPKQILNFFLTFFSKHLSLRTVSRELKVNSGRTVI